MENNEVVYRNDQVAPRLTINFIVPVVSGSNRARLRFQAGRAGTYDSTNMCRVTDGQAEDFTLALEPVSIKNLTYLKGVSAYPNPSTGKVQVQASFGHTGRAAVRLYGADGRLLEQRDMTHSANALTEPIDISNYAKGLYWVEIITGTQQSRICISRQ